MINPGNDKKVLLGVENFGKRLHQLLDGQSSGSFAKACGINPSTMNKYLNPEPSKNPMIPGIDKVLLISKYTGRSLAWLITGEEEKPVSTEELQARWRSAFTDMTHAQQIAVINSFKQSGVQGTINKSVFSHDKTES